MAKFRITYPKYDRNVPEDPEQNEVVEMEFTDSYIKETDTTITAREWAEDWAYMAADKGPFTVEEIDA